MYNEYVAGKYINRQIMIEVPKVILFVHKNGRIKKMTAIWQLFRNINFNEEEK